MAFHGPDEPTCAPAYPQPDWVVARHWQIHRTNRLLLAIDLVEKLINQVPEHSKEAGEFWEKHTNLTRALVNHRRLSLKGH